MFGSRKSISGKYSIFRKCYLPERKMFLCVWLYFKKFFEKYFLVFRKCYKEKDKTRKTNTAPRLMLAIDWLRRRSTVFDGVKRRSRSAWSRDHDRQRDLAKRRSRSREALRRSRSARRRVRDLGSRSTALVLANGVDWSLDVRTASTGSLSPSCTLALSLSLSLEFIWSENRNGNSFP